MGHSHNDTCRDSHLGTAKPNTDSQLSDSVSESGASSCQIGKGSMLSYQELDILHKDYPVSPHRKQYDILDKNKIMTSCIKPFGVSKYLHGKDQEYAELHWELSPI